MAIIVGSGVFQLRRNEKDDEEGSGVTIYRVLM